MDLPCCAPHAHTMPARPYEHDVVQISRRCGRTARWLPTYPSCAAAAISARSALCRMCAAPALALAALVSTCVSDVSIQSALPASDPCHTESSVSGSEKTAELRCKIATPCTQQADGCEGNRCVGGSAAVHWTPSWLRCPGAALVPRACLTRIYCLPCLQCWNA